MNRKLGAVLCSRLNALRNKAVVAHDMEHVSDFAAGSEGEIPVEPDIFLSPVLIGMAYHEHLREVRISRRVLDSVDPDGFGLEESEA